MLSSFKEISNSFYNTTLYYRISEIEKNFRFAYIEIPSKYQLFNILLCNHPGYLQPAIIHVFYISRVYDHYIFLMFYYYEMIYFIDIMDTIHTNIIK